MLIRGYSQLSFNENLTPLKRGLIKAYPCHSSVISPWLSLTGSLKPVSTGTSVGSVHIYWPGTVPEYGTRWGLMSPHFFKCPRQSLVTMPVNYKVEIPGGGRGTPDFKWRQWSNGGYSLPRIFRLFWIPKKSLLKPTQKTPSIIPVTKKSGVATPPPLPLGRYLVSGDLSGRGNPFHTSRTKCINVYNAVNRNARLLLFEFSSAGIKISIWINSADLN